MFTTENEIIRSSLKADTQAISPMTVHTMVYSISLISILP
jgi:hypothetical protein